jgi:hypothetical protein
MSIFRPSDGFRIIEKSAVTKLITANAKNWPRLPAFWDAIKERLKMTGHREGIPISRPGSRLFVEDGDPSVGLPKVKVVYHVLATR